MRIGYALLVAALAIAFPRINASKVAAPTAGISRPLGLLQGWGLPRHETILDRVSNYA